MLRSGVICFVIKQTIFTNRVRRLAVKNRQPIIGCLHFVQYLIWCGGCFFWRSAACEQFFKNEACKLLSLFFKVWNLDCWCDFTVPCFCFIIVVPKSFFRNLILLYIIGKIGEGVRNKRCDFVLLEVCCYKRTDRAYNWNNLTEVCAFHTCEQSFKKLSLSWG